MPIAQIHTYAAQRLALQTTIKGFESFLVGNVFPDAPWTLDTNGGPIVYLSTDDNYEIVRLHPAIYKGTLRLPNFIDFASEHAKDIVSSSFLQGDFFHLCVDYYFNSWWSEHITDNTDGTFDLFGERHVSLERLMEIKYGGMLAFILQKDCDVALPMSCSTEAVNKAFRLFDVSVTELQSGLLKMNSIIESQRNIDINDICDCTSAPYDVIVNQAIGIFLTYKKLMDWR